MSAFRVCTNRSTVDEKARHVRFNQLSEAPYSEFQWAVNITSLVELTCRERLFKEQRPSASIGLNDAPLLFWKLEGPSYTYPNEQEDKWLYYGDIADI